MATPPSIKFSEFAISGVDPVGQRHLTTHSSFVKALGTSAGEFLDFGSLNTTFTKKITPTKSMVAFFNDFNDVTEAVFNMRLWLTDISDFTKGTFNFNGYQSGVWESGLATQGLSDASGLFNQTALPSGANLRRQDGWPEISGINSDSEVTEFMYTSVDLDTDVPSKSYGGNSGGFIYRITFDFR